MPKSWIAHSERVGRGDSALTYLARYLYRGVISENNILSLEDDQVTFRYKDSKTKKYKTIKEPATKFLWRIIQHVLPKGFRRARNFGFLHGNAARTLKRLQLLLKVVLPPMEVKPKKIICCPHCAGEMDCYLMRIGLQLILRKTNRTRM